MITMKKRHNDSVSFYFGAIIIYLIDMLHYKMIAYITECLNSAYIDFDAIHLEPQLISLHFLQIKSNMINPFITIYKHRQA